MFTFQGSRRAGGGGGIRTHETLSGLTVFKTAGVNRFPTPPALIVAYLLDSDRVRSCPIVAQFPFQTLHCSNGIRTRSLDVEGEGGADVRVPENRLNRPGRYPDTMQVRCKPAPERVPTMPAHSAAFQRRPYDFGTHRGQVPRATARPGEDKPVLSISLGVFSGHPGNNRS